MLIKLLANQVNFDKYLILVENWRIQFDSTGTNLFATGELGSIKKYDIESTEIIETLKT